METKPSILSAQGMVAKYGELGREYKYPYFYKIENEGKLLYFVGSAHFYDSPDAAAILRINSYWKQFLQETFGKERLVYVESQRAKSLGSMKQSVSEFGEAGLMMYLANKDSVETFCPEPDRKLEMNELLKYFPKEDVAYYYFARVVNVWYRRKKQSDFQTFIKRHLQRDKESSGWEDFDFSLENLIRIHDKKFGHSFDLESCFRCIADASHPAKNEVAEKCSEFRNIHLINTIKKDWDKGTNIFILYGAGHAIVCEPALKQLLK